ncbi:ABC transporter permease [Thermoanaerobacteraceae bacterium SP2]|nr:ABC transporter permease [Thermoanaerobacteraceae bacterium SP2]
MELKTIIKKYSGLVIFAFVFLIGAIWTPVFIQSKNILDIVQYSCETGLLAAGMTLVIISGGSGIDLSVGSNVALGCMIAASTQASMRFPTFLSVLAAIMVCGLIGALNGVLITKGKLQPFVATLITMIGARALALLTNGGMPISTGIPESYRIIASGKIGPIYYTAVIWIVMIVMVDIILKNTKFGTDLIATGGNAEAAYYSGIEVNKVRFIAYTICGMLAGLAGAILTSRLMIGEPRSGYGYELLAIASVVMGGTSMEGGRGSALGTMFGVLTLGAIKNLLNVANVNMFMQQVVQGIVVLLAILVPIFTGYLNERLSNTKINA